MPATSTPSRDARPATAPSIARRWSPWEAIVPAAQAAGARDDEAVVGGLDGRRRGRAGPSTTVAIRSDSLSRSSAAPRTTVSPSAKQPSSATSGSSSIASGHLVGLDDGGLERARPRRRGR